ncbi:Major facilitator-type transporter ecdD [Penicillium chermesinum]|uniref:Major facilitator-type transporter ecdD n=1 Tax=Penicillium chermesinum TaxID=63820 RepID=A0A9W9TN07_9EURO|nr:Major facilitator-type transporter ecdD [Penicillium chermesinum]KAJ5232510.1 Major facilitator-type transporter ecdD [Penicillium chermesinum]
MSTTRRVVGTDDLNLVEAKVTWHAYMLCCFASFGGILYGYDTGYISGLLGMNYVKEHLGHKVPTSVDPSGFIIPSSRKSLITSIMSAGTFFGAIFGGAIAERIGRRLTIMLCCLVFSAGVAVQIGTNDSVGGLSAGRFIAGLGTGGVSSTVILYVSEIAPYRVRGILVSSYQWAITLGWWSLPLPESPRYYVQCDNMDGALRSLERVRGQPGSDPAIQAELAEIKANYEYEKQISSNSWFDCFKGGMSPYGNLRRVLVGVCLQMFQQWTGINFIFYYGTTFFQQVGIKNAFLISTIMNIVNVCSTPVSLISIERVGRRKLLLWGAAFMCACEFIVAGVGTGKEGSHTANICLIVFTCFYISAFAMTWGPCAWVVIGEIYPLPIRAKGVGLATASNWLWNCVIAVITPYIVDTDKGNLRAKVFFVWGGAILLALLFVFFFIPETKGLTLEQVDRMLEETTPMTSTKWKPHDTFAHEMGLTDKHETAATVVEHHHKPTATSETIGPVV